MRLVDVLPSSTPSPGRPEMQPLSHSSRRTFIAGAALASTSAMLPRFSAASPLIPRWPLLCSLGDNTLALMDASASPRGTVVARTASPRAHAQHPTLPITYVANAIPEHQGRPCGAISAFHLAPGGHDAALLGTEPLALFSTRPESLAVSPSGEHLVVLSTHGGSINLLPLTATGRLTPVTHVLRFPSCGTLASQARSAPNAITFHSSRPLAYVSDQVTDAVLVLHLDGNSLNLIHRHQLPAAFQPTYLAFSIESSSLFVASANTPSVMELSLEPATDVPADRSRRHTVPGESVGPLLINPLAGSLFVTSRHRSSAVLSEVALASSSPATSTVLVPLSQTPAHLVLLDPRHLAVAGPAGLSMLHLQSHAVTLLSQAGVCGLSTWPMT